MPNQPSDAQKAMAAKMVHDGGANAQPLNQLIKIKLESQFGTDLSSVRVLTGPTASAACQSLGAKAFAVGDRVFLSVGSDPNSADTQNLIAHELTHVVQQRAGKR